MSFWTPTPMDEYGNTAGGGAANNPKPIVEVDGSGPGTRVLGPAEYQRNWPTINTASGYWSELPDDAGPARMVSFEEWALMIGFAIPKGQL